MADGPRPRVPTAGVGELPVVRKLRARRDGKKPFQQPHVLPWVLGGLASLGVLVALGFLLPERSDVVIIASTTLALFFLLFALGLVANLGRRAAVVAVVATGLLYAVTAWTPLVGVKSALVLALLVAFVVFALAGFNVLFVVEEVLFDIHRQLHIRGTFWNAVPTLVLIGVTPLVYWLLPLVGLRWPTLQIGMPLVLLLLLIAWIVRWRVGPHALELVHEAHFLSIGIIVGAGLADIVAMLHQVEGIIPSIVAYLSIIVTWVFVSYTTLQRAQYFLRAGDVLPWMALLFASAFAVLAHVHFLYGTAGAPGLAAVQDVRVNYLVFGVWLGLLFFVVRGVWRFFRFVRDEKRLGSRARSTAGRFARVMEEAMHSSNRLERIGGRVLYGLDRVIPGGERRAKQKRRRRRRDD